MNPNAITREVIGAAMRVHSALGPGLLETAYRACLGRELELRGLRYESEVPVPVTYRGLTIRPHTGWICWLRTSLLSKPKRCPG